MATAARFAGRWAAYGAAALARAPAARLGAAAATVRPVAVPENAPNAHRLLQLTLKYAAVAFSVVLVQSHASAASFCRALAALPGTARVMQGLGVR